VFELKQQSRNCRHVGNSPTCRQMSCRLGTLADTTFSCVCDMTETCRRHVADTTQNVAVWAKKRHADIRHVELSLADLGERKLPPRYVRWQKSRAIMYHMLTSKVVALSQHI